MFTLFEKKKKSAPYLKTPISEASYVVIDTELTGLDESRDSIVSIGAVRISRGRINLGDSFYRLVSPRTSLTPESVLIHEITPSEVIASPSIEAVLAEFLDFCGHDPLVGHFISIDLSFLNREVKSMGGGEIQNSAIDTFSIYEWLRSRWRLPDCFVLPGEGRLYDIIRSFGIAVNTAHNAMMDAYATAQLFQRFLPLLREAGVKDIDDLLNIGIPFKGGDRVGLSCEFSNF